MLVGGGGKTFFQTPLLWMIKTLVWILLKPPQTHVHRKWLFSLYNLIRHAFRDQTICKKDQRSLKLIPILICNVLNGCWQKVNLFFFIQLQFYNYSLCQKKPTINSLFFLWAPCYKVTKSKAYLLCWLFCFSCFCEWAVLFSDFGRANIIDYTLVPPPVTSM